MVDFYGRGKQIYKSHGAYGIGHIIQMKCEAFQNTTSLLVLAGWGMSSGGWDSSFFVGEVVAGPPTPT